MASSRPIAAGETYTPDDINNLRCDVLDAASGHAHDGVDGARIAFADLDVAGAGGSTAPPGGSSSYQDLADHVASSQGQHGLAAAVHVAGAAAAGILVQAGTDTLANLSKAVTFPLAFSEAPVVTVTVYGSPGSQDYTEQGPWLSDRSPTGFTVRVRGDWANATFGWIAVGAAA